MIDVTQNTQHRQMASPVYPSQSSYVYRATVEYSYVCV